MDAGGVIFKWCFAEHSSPCFCIITVVENSVSHIVHAWAHRQLWLANVARTWLRICHPNAKHGCGIAGTRLLSTVIKGPDWLYKDSWHIISGRDVHSGVIDSTETVRSGYPLFHGKDMFRSLLIQYSWQHSQSEVHWNKLEWGCTAWHS